MKLKEVVEWRIGRPWVVDLARAVVGTGWGEGRWSWSSMVKGLR